MQSNKSIVAFNRVKKVLDFIHGNLSEPLSLDKIATQSCWSRWQLQRVFQNATGTTVANYVREVKLSDAAERLLDSSDRVIDIATYLGFNSEISFSRAFKSMFGVSPRSYRQAGVRTGLRKPIEVQQIQQFPSKQTNSFVDIRVETKPSFSLVGIHDYIDGLFSYSQNFSVKVPTLWQQLLLSTPEYLTHKWPLTGVINMTQSNNDGTNLIYWAGVIEQKHSKFFNDIQKLPEGLSSLEVPEQTYAVVKHTGKVMFLPQTLNWLILDWLPQSNYRGIDGFDLEHYPADYEIDSEEAVMEYWLAIEKHP